VPPPKQVVSNCHHYNVDLGERLGDKLGEVLGEMRGEGSQRPKATEKTYWEANLSCLSQ
jgi:hypothetical protein